MTQTSLVSVCMPCRNAEPHVAAAIDSVLQQSWTQWELIVINDGSSDRSLERIRSVSDPRLRVLSGCFGSAARARNAAFAASQGDSILFFDADDLLSPLAIEAQLTRLAGHSDAVAMASWGRFYGNDLASFRPDPQRVWRDMDARDWLVEAWAEAQPMTQPGQFLIPRALIEVAGGWDETLTLIDDFEFFARVLVHAKEVLFTPEATLYYRSGIQGSLSAQKNRAAQESAFHSLLRGTGHLLARRSDAAARRACANVLQNFIYGLYPEHADLRAAVAQRVAELGGSNLPVPGGPTFQLMRRALGWKGAKRLQRALGRGF
ncbi:glycosyltransferase family 2 protein [Cyanobium sp. Morenito 9A2]|nr:glycosyltransferase family 2 protein [Cyanobium sp. Morenito 9A2]